MIIPIPAMSDFFLYALLSLEEWHPFLNSELKHKRNILAS